MLKLFGNARLYNAEDSQIYADALTMEAAFKSLPAPTKKRKKTVRKKEPSDEEDSSSSSSSEEEESEEEEEESEEEESESEQAGNDPLTKRMQRAIHALVIVFQPHWPSPKKSTFGFVLHP